MAHKGDNFFCLVNNFRPWENLPFIWCLFHYAFNTISRDEQKEHSKYIPCSLCYMPVEAKVKHRKSKRSAEELCVCTKKIVSNMIANVIWGHIWRILRTMPKSWDFIFWHEAGNRVGPVDILIRDEIWRKHDYRT